MTETNTLTQTYTETGAVYLAHKVAPDLLQMQRFYGKPTSEEIDNYMEELKILLLEGVLDSVDYGYRKNNSWIVMVRYSANYGSSSSTDNRSGGIYPGADVSDAQWGSFLRWSSKFDNLPQTEKDRITKSLPINRTPQDEPGFEPGNWISNKNYYNDGISLERKMFRPN